MLQKLYIKNFVIIDTLTIEFDSHLNVLTGETGAGKSIILGALSLILGDRADPAQLRDRAEKCIIEAAFDSTPGAVLQQIFAEADLDFDPQTTIIRREISPAGKSRAFINDTPVNLGVLNKITSFLVDLHRQFDNHSLKDHRFSFEVIDTVSKHTDTLATYQQLFGEWQQARQRLAAETEKVAAWQQEADYKQFLYDELENAQFEDNEIETTEATIRQLSHTEQIKLVLEAVDFQLESDEQPINSSIKRLQQQLQSISEFHPEAGALADRLDSVWIELRDIASESQHLQTRVHIDPDQLSRMQERLDLGYRLLKKHQVADTAALIAKKRQLHDELTAHSDGAARIADLTAALSELEAQLTELAATLHRRREAQIPLFEESVNDLIRLVGMPNARLTISLEAQEEPDYFGKDQITFLWDANKSGQLQPLAKVASGGELSRVMLCIKSLMAEAMALPTLIFDEVDTGISGEAARQVALLLKSLASRHQVICITHQPQVAGKGTRHFYVYKTSSADTVQTRVKVLTPSERVQAVAQMIGGDEPTAAAIRSAKELVAS